MNYTDWRKWYANQPFDYPPSAKDGWFACKREILKILNQNLIQDMSEIEVAKLFEKIEKL